MVLKKAKASSKIRKLFHLDVADTDIIKKLANSKKVSESEVIRTAIRELGIKEGVVSDPFAKLIGSVTAGKDQAVKHDKVIYE